MIIPELLRVTYVCGLTGCNEKYRDLGRKKQQIKIALMNYTKWCMLYVIIYCIKELYVTCKKLISLNERVCMISKNCCSKKKVNIKYHYFLFRYFSELKIN